MQEKYKLLGPNGVLSVPELPEDWRERNGEGCPLFWHESKLIAMEKIVRCCGWHESKPIALWCALLDEWKVHAVLDCSPGSGALMEAALTRGIVYHGFCLDLSWLCHMICF